jgi:hypothetical protein
VVDKEAGGIEIASRINVSSDGVNRINYIQHIHWVWMHVCDIPNIVANFSSTGAYADQPNLSCSNGKISLKTQRRQTKVRMRFGNKWMVRRFPI